MYTKKRKWCTEDFWFQGVGLSEGGVTWWLWFQLRPIIKKNSLCWLSQLLLTHDEEDSADEHASREHMLRADLLGRFAHRAQLVCQRVSPEVGQQQGAQKEWGGAEACAPRRLHLCVADGLDIKLQYHYGEDDHPKRQDEGRPRFYFTLELRQRAKTVSEEFK